MYLEFFGIPGVGKTTTSEIILERYGYSKIVKINSIANTNPIYNILAGIKALSIYNVIRRNYNIIDKKEWKKFKRSLFVCLYHYYEKRNKFGVYVTDHGIIQTLSQLSFLRLESNIEILGKIINKLPWGNIKYIYLNAPYKVAMKRGLKRAKINKNSFNRSDYELITFMKMYNRVSMHFKLVSVIDATKTKKNIEEQLDELWI